MNNTTFTEGWVFGKPRKEGHYEVQLKWDDGLASAAIEALLYLHEAK